MRCVLFAVLFVCTVAAQNTGNLPRFDFVSIRRASERDSGCSARINSPLQFNVHGCTARGLIFFSWKLRDWEMSLPSNVGWISSVPWDVNAKSSSPAPATDHWQMMQAVLKERFSLKFHHEIRQLPLYHLSVAKGGPKLAGSKPGNGCVPFDRKAPPPMPRPGEPPYCDYVSMPFTKDNLGAQIIGTQLSITSLLRPLTILLGRPVLDKTGLTGAYDVQLTFAKDSIPVLNVAVGGMTASSAPSGYPDIFTAVRALGIQLEAVKGPVDVLVVDSVQKPTEN